MNGVIGRRTPKREETTFVSLCVFRKMLDRGEPDDKILSVPVHDPYQL